MAPATFVIAIEHIISENGIDKYIHHLPGNISKRAELPNTFIMHLPTRIIGLLILVTILVNCSSPSDSERDELEEGTFEITTSGIIEENISGEATFSLYEIATHPEPFLRLNLKAGDIPFVPDSLSDGYGLFVDIPWDSTQLLTLTDDTYSVYISRSSFFPYFPHPLSSGTISVDRQAENLISGQINITDTLAYPDSGAIIITGKYSAIRAQPE